MSTGTIWRVGDKSEARLLWEERFPPQRLQIDIKFIAGLELCILRCQLHGISTFDPKVEVYDIAFPNVTDPEWEEHYENIEDDYNRTIEFVLPDFLDELRAIPKTDIALLGAEWGVRCDAWWHKKWPEHAPEALQEFIRVAKTAECEGKGVLVTQYD